MQLKESIKQMVQTAECHMRLVHPECEPVGHPAGAPPKKPDFKKILITTSALLLLGLGGTYGFKWYQVAASHQVTDDAYITGHLHQVSTRVNGTVDEVLVDDNEHVTKGQPLVILDGRDYQSKVDQALAALEQAQKQASAAHSSIAFQDTTASGQNINASGSVDNALAAISRAEAAVREGKARISAAQADLTSRDAEFERSKLDFSRYEQLEREGAISTSQKDAAKRDYLVAQGARESARQTITEASERLLQAQAAVTSGRAQLTQAQGQLQLAKASSLQTRVTEAQFATDLAAVNRAKAMLDEAQLNLSYTTIVAPTTGRIGKKTVEAGQRVEPGQPLMSIVSDDAWVVANYKETQLKNIQAGQPVEIEIDSLPEHKFTGTVQSFSPASGASFSLLPSDNATGNFTKIVQRLPVKILFDPASIHGYEDRLAPGLSVITRVNVSKHAVTQHQIAEAR